MVGNLAASVDWSGGLHTQVVGGGSFDPATGAWQRDTESAA